MTRWTDAPKGQVLAAFARHVGRPVTVIDYTRPAPTVDEKLKALADRIVSEG